MPFSGYVYLTPDNNGEQGFEVSIQPGRNGKYRVRFKGPGSWLIVCKRRQVRANGEYGFESSTHYDLRDELCHTQAIHDEACGIVQINRLEDYYFDEDTLYDSDPIIEGVEFELSKGMLGRSYIIGGLSRLCYDGGFRWTVDLPAFLDAFEDKAL